MACDRPTLAAQASQLQTEAQTKYEKDMESHGVKVERKENHNGEVFLPDEVLYSRT